MSSSSIHPTVGRKVWYRPAGQNDDSMSRFKTAASGPDPMDATIVGVCTPSRVNLVVNDALGQRFIRIGVFLAQEGEDVPGSDPYCEWMPFQKGQAATAELPPTLAAAVPGPIQPGSAPSDMRVTLEDIEITIRNEFHFTALDGVNGAASNSIVSGYDFLGMPATEESLSLMTFCVLVLHNGFKVVGQSACANPKQFNANQGRQYAREDAIRQLWPLLGYELRSKLAQG